MPGPQRSTAPGPAGLRAALVALCLLAVASTVLGLLLFADNRSLGGTNRFFDPVMPVLAISFTAAGAFLAARRPDVLVGWLLCAGALVGLSFFAEQYAVQALQARPGQLPGGRAMAWLGETLWAPAYLASWILLPLLFPDGRLPSRRWRPVLWAAVAVIGASAVLAAMAPAGAPAGEGTAGVAGALYAAGVFVLAPACWAGLLTRYRRAGPGRRRQLEWPLRATGAAVAVPVGTVLAGVVLGLWVPLTLYQVAAAAALASVPAAIVGTVVRDRLYELDVKADAVVDRLVVHAVLTLLGTGAFLVARGLLHVVTPDGDRFGIALASVVVAVLVALRLRAGLERRVDRILYRRRDYDYRVLSSLGRSLHATLGADALLPTVVEAVATGLRLPYAGVAVGQEPEVTVAAASFGHPGDADLLDLPLVHQSESVGRLTVAPRGPKEPFDATDRRLLGDVAGQLAVVAYALCLTADLQRSRERLVTAREEERSRLRRDLHDGLQPALSGVLLGLDTARNILGRAGAADELLALLRTELETAAGDVRRLVYGLRPPALDELGLVGALRQHASMFALSPSGPDVVVTAPDDLSGLPAAVEVATYRICQEALENVRKHASAGTCEIVLAAGDGELLVEVRDDGHGLRPDAGGGVGLRAMRERVAELGGTCAVQTAAGTGTAVRAVLPTAPRR